MELAKEITEMRKAAGLTQVELAERAGVGLRFVRELEQGKPTVRLDKVNQVLASLAANSRLGRNHDSPGRRVFPQPSGWPADGAA